MTCIQCKSEDMVTGLRVVDREEDNHPYDLEITLDTQPGKVFDK